MEKFNEEFDLTEKVTIGDIAETLIRAAARIHKYHISIAFGQDPPEGFEKGNKDYQQKILSTVEPLLKNYQEIKAITANSAGAVVRLLGAGKITATEAISLLNVIKTKVEVEEDELALRYKKQLIKEVDAEENKDED